MERPVMILTVGSEEITIERNDLFSDDDVMSDSSSCVSNSGFEEIEIGASVNVWDQRKDENLPNPYVKLVRCDHLLGETLSCLKSKRRKHVTNRLSSRMRHSNSSFVSNGVHLNDRGKRKAPTMKKKKPKNIPKCNKITRHKRSSTSKSTSIKNSIKNSRTKLGKKFKQHYLNENTFGYDINLRVSGMPSNYEDVDTSEELPMLTIKEEPYDDYFDVMTENNTCTTSYNRSIYPVNFPKIQFNTSIKQEPEISPEIDNITFMGRMNDRKNKEKFIREKINRDSSDSEVDVEKDWERQLFPVDPKLVEFEHSYALQQKTILYPLGIISNKAVTNVHAMTNLNKPISETTEKHFAICSNTTTKMTKAQIKVQNIIESIEEQSEKHLRRNSESRNRHRTNEQISRALLKHSFSRLQNEIPDLYGLEKTSKNNILTRACQYIKSLKEEERLLVKAINNEKVLRSKLTKQLQESK